MPVLGRPLGVSIGVNMEDKYVLGTVATIGAILFGMLSIWMNNADIVIPALFTFLGIVIGACFGVSLAEHANKTRTSP